jgi:hypothetical protein
VRLLIGDFEQEERTFEQTVELCKGCSFADIEQILLKAKRKAIIEDAPLSYRVVESSYTEYNPRVEAI